MGEAGRACWKSGVISPTGRHCTVGDLGAEPVYTRMTEWFATMQEAA